MRGPTTRIRPQISARLGTRISSRKTSRLCKAITPWVTQCLSVALLSGCYVDASKDGHAPLKRQPTSAHDPAQARHPEICRFYNDNGCLNAHVDALQNFFVDGKEFFNADDLSNRLHELIHVESHGKPLEPDAIGAGGYKLTLTAPLDNDSFATGFSYDLTGPVARSGEIRQSGNFNSDDLPVGDYRLRVQRSVKFQLVKLASAPATPAPDQGNTQEPPTAPAHTDNAPTANSVALATEPDHASQAPTSDSKPIASAGKFYCATLYTDAEVSIRENQALWLNFNHFHLHLSANECNSAVLPTTLQL